MLVLAVVSVTLTVIGPRILGHATNIIVAGVPSAQGIDFGDAAPPAAASSLLVYLCAWTLAYTQGFMLAGVVQRSMRKLRTDVEDKLNRLPLAYVDSQPRGDLLSRVTNDIDNLAQSLQQTLSQMFTRRSRSSACVIMMISISPLLALISSDHRPGRRSSVIKTITARSKKRFIAQWTHTGTLNAQVEEAFTGHALVRAFGQRARRRSARFDEKNEELYEASFGAQFISGVDPARDDVPRQPELRRSSP